MVLGESYVLPNTLWDLEHLAFVLDLLHSVRLNSCISFLHPHRFE
jgi:hypothetical protein